MQTYTDNVVDRAGNTLSGAQVTVYLADGTTRATLPANPIVTGADGEFSFALPDGKYVVSVSHPLIATKTEPVYLFDSTTSLIPTTEEKASFVNIPTTEEKAGLAGISAADPAVQSSEAVHNVATIAALRLLPVVAGKAVQPLGYYASGDGGGGPVRVGKTAAPGTYVDNGGSIIVPTGGDGSAAWVWEWSGEVNVAWFGLSAGNSAAANTAVINSAISAVSRYSHLDFPAGTFDHNSITINKGLVIKGQGRYATQLRNVEVGAPAILIEASTGFVSHFAMSNITLRGNGTTLKGSDATTGQGILARGLVEFSFENLLIIYHGSHGIELGQETVASANGIYQGSIVNCDIEQNKGDGIKSIATGTTDQKNAVLIEDSNIAQNGGNGINHWGYTHWIQNNSIQGNIGAGILISSDNPTSNYSSHLTLIQENHFETNAGGHVVMKTASGKAIVGVTIVSNYFHTDTDDVTVGVTADIFITDAGNALSALVRGLTCVKNIHSPFGTTATTWIYANFGGGLSLASLIEPSHGTLTTDNELSNRYIGFGAARVNWRKQQVIHGATNIMGATNITWSGYLKSDNITVSGANAFFPIALPTNTVLHRAGVYVDTDATAFTVEFTVLKRAHSGVGAYSAVTLQSVTGAASGFISTSDFPALTGIANTRITPVSNLDDWTLKITVTLTTPGTYFYLGNPVLWYN